MIDTTAHAASDHTQSVASNGDFSFSSWTNLPPLEKHVQFTTSSPDQANLAERVFAVIVLVLLVPLFAAIGLAIMLEPPRGSIVFRQLRVGVDRRSAQNDAVCASDPERRTKPGNGRPFWIWKFRTMIPNAEANTGPVWAAERDHRITRVGRVLRHLRLDELPQLINVAGGEMRLIGPRPERPEFVSQLASEIPDYTRRLAIAPGITGLAQVERTYDASVEDVRKKLRYDVFYANNRSWLMDFKILVKTIEVVARRRGAH